MADLTNEERIAQQLQVVPGALAQPVVVGNARLAITGFKFEDKNADGIRQANEGSFQPPVSFSFLLEPAIATNGQASNGIYDESNGDQKTITDPNGRFSFRNLVPGNYVVTETPVPSGFRSTTRNPLSVVLATTNADVLFGNAGPQSSKIVGCKYLDLDNDGFRDGDEPGIKNVKIYLDRNGNGQFDAGIDDWRLTDKNGKWEFNVAPGTYKVREERLKPPAAGSILREMDTSVPPTAEPLEADFLQSTPPDNVPALDVTVAPGETFACAQVGNTPLYTITVKKFEDTDRNGIQNGLEPIVPRVPFILDLNKNGKFDSGEKIQITGGDGVTTFKGLRADNYSVLEIFPSVLPAEFGGGAPGNRDLPVPTTANPVLIAAPGPQAEFQGTISREQPLLVKDDGYKLKPNDPKFIDSNRDGIKQPNEKAIAATGERPIFTNTPVTFPAPNPDPLLSFSPLVPANNGIGGNSPVGNTRPSINVFKYNDLNANGRYEPELDEAGLNDVEVFLDTNNDGQLQRGVERVERTRSLRANERPDIVEPKSRIGRALFDNLPAGNYTVRETVPAGFSPSTNAVVPLTIGLQDANVTFANTLNSNITGCKFEDFNQNGYRDGNEPAISDVIVYIDSNNDGKRQPTERFEKTDKFGTFGFINLVPGTYTIREELSPAQLNFSQTTQPLNIVLGPNQTFTCALIGNTRLYDLKVEKFRDDNRNGIRDGNEGPLDGIPFVLDVNKNGSYDPSVDSQVKTTVGGVVVFEGLLPGTYSVLEVFNTPGVDNPFPIATGPNPVNFDVPDPNNQYTVPSPPRPAATPQRAIMSLDPLTGDTGVAMATATATATADRLTNGGSSLDATVQASSVDSLIAPQSAAMSFVDLNKFKDSLSSLPTVTTTDNSLDKLLLAAPATTPLF